MKDHMKGTEDGMIETNGSLEKEIHMNTVNFEKCFIAAQQITEPLKLGKKMRVIIDYDPQKERAEFRYFTIEE